MVLSDTATFFYKCDNYYNKEHDAGIRFNDPTIGIDWQLDPSLIQVSEKDAALPFFADAKNNFQY